MKEFYLLIFGLVGFTSALWAEPTQIVIDNPYHFGARMPEGKYQGQLLNIKERRPITKLNGSQLSSSFSVSSHEYLLANIYHNQEFYIGIVPRAAVKQVYFLSEPFARVFAHSMLRFQLDTPVRLVARQPSAEEWENGVPFHPLETPIELNDLILSVEAVAPPGIVEFSAWENLFRTRALVFRMISLTGRGVRKYLSGNVRVKQIPIDLTERDANRAFRNAVETSHAFGLSQMYTTLFDNCNRHCFELLELSRPYVSHHNSDFANFVGTVQAIATKVIIFSKIYPVLAQFGLSWRGLIDERLSPMPLFGDDPDFRKLAATYPGLCFDELTPQRQTPF